MLFNTTCFALVHINYTFLQTLLPLVVVLHEVWLITLWLARTKELKFESLLVSKACNLQTNSANLRILAKIMQKNVRFEINNRTFHSFLQGCLLVHNRKFWSLEAFSSGSVLCTAVQSTAAAAVCTTTSWSKVVVVENVLFAIISIAFGGPTWFGALQHNVKQA